MNKKPEKKHDFWESNFHIIGVDIKTEKKIKDDLKKKLETSLNNKNKGDN